jgi:peptide/nickel transport system ATP-binding protein
MELLEDARGLLDRVSGDRIRSELELIFREPALSAIMARLDELDLLQAIHPALAWDDWLQARWRAAREFELPQDWKLARGPQLQDLYLALWCVRLEPGEAVGLVGRSGSGKTTAARLLLRLRRPQAGRVLYRGRDVWSLEGSGLLAYRRDVQPVFQDPGGSLNPRLRVGAIVREPLEVHGLARGPEARDHARAAMEDVGLDPAMASRYPRELSGGECQRVALARALLLEPRILVADEPTSALDVSVQAAILNLFLRLRAERGLGLLLISHDLGVIRHACRRVLVMDGGEVVERGPTERIFRWPQDPRTRSLVEAASSGMVAT